MFCRSFGFYEYFKKGEISFEVCVKYEKNSGTEFVFQKFVYFEYHEVISISEHQHEKIDKLIVVFA